MKLKNKKVAVIGLGLTGRAVVNFLLKKKADITVFDEKRSSEFKDIDGLREKGVGFNFGPFNFARIAEAQLIVLSPGVSIFKFPEFGKLEQPNREIISEIELAWRFFKGKLICITGTNGKSTTATLVHHLFGVGGKKSYLLGNIGTPFIGQVENIGPREYAVVEVSCFQLEGVKSFKPDYVILTNITQDHLDRYPSMESYLETRKNIFKNMGSEDRVILNFDDPLTGRHFSAGPNPGREGLPKGQAYWFSRSSEVPRGAFLKGHNFIFRKKIAFGDDSFAAPRVCFRRKHRGRGKFYTFLGRDKEDTPFFDLADFSLMGTHNIENALAASLPPILEGIKISLIRKGLKGFRGLNHRMQFVTRFEGVDFINDSKATNVDAVLKAVSSLNSAFERIVVIMGGKDKGGTFSLLKPAFNDRIKLLVLIGEDASKIRAELAGVVAIKEAACMKEAVRLSWEKAKPGGVVLLSPGCASFDMFDSFEQRGEVFKEEVMRLASHFHLGGGSGRRGE